MDVTHGEGLHEDITEGGGFDRAGGDSDSAGVRGELLEEFVFNPAPDDMEGFDFFAGDLRDFFQGHTVKTCEAFECATDDLTMGLWDGLTFFAAEPLDFRGHIAGFQESGIIRVNE